MSLKHTLGSAALIAAMALGTGCVVRAHGRVSAPVAYVEVEEEPPPPRVVVMPAPRPGFIWIEGRWTWSGGRYIWHDGYYERERVGSIYEQGRWERRGRGHVWVDGHWRGGGEVRDDGPGVRDHRGGPPPREDRDNGPRVRDHRH
jgi:YXWGXW repeat-containing protein